MGITHPDIKRLWGLAAGRCSYPGCPTLCVDHLLDEAEPLILGEMAHVIAEQPSGPRGTPAGGDAGYDNRILLCPTHHRMVDKAPKSFPPNTLMQWKAEHEAQVAAALASPAFADIIAVSEYIRKLLTENRILWKTFGPESLRAAANPLSNTVTLWTLRKLDTVVPNNRRIIDTLRRHKDLFDADSYAITCAFVVHAEAFELSCYSRMEDVPRFPPEFEEMIDTYANL